MKTDKKNRHQYQDISAAESISCQEAIAQSQVGGIPVATYKASRFNLVVKQDEATWFHVNSHSCNFLAMDEKAHSVASTLLEKAGGGLGTDDMLAVQHRGVLERLIHGRFLVPPDHDELAQCKSEYLLSTFRQERLMVTMIPTWRCNLACSYCEQSNLNRSLMPDLEESVEDRIIEFLTARLAHAKVLSLEWFGGEPMLRADIVIRATNKLAAICQARGIELSMSLITNGTLPMRESLEAIHPVKPRAIQVTLDGPAHVHDRRRIGPAGSPTFAKIVQNVIHCWGMTEQISIRINTDEAVCPHLDELVDYLDRHLPPDRENVEVKVHVAERVDYYANNCERLRSNARYALIGCCNAPYSGLYPAATRSSTPG